jgi:hypothetical protein
MIGKLRIYQAVSVKPNPDFIDTINTPEDRSRKLCAACITRYRMPRGAFHKRDAPLVITEQVKTRSLPHRGHAHGDAFKARFKKLTRMLQNGRCKESEIGVVQ